MKLMRTTIFLVLAVAALGAVGVTTAIMSSAIPAHAVEQCSIRGSTQYCTGGYGNGPTSGIHGEGGHSTTNLNTGEFTASGGGNNPGGGGSGGHQTFKNGQYSCAGNICP